MPPQDPNWQHLNTTGPVHVLVPRQVTILLSPSQNESLPRPHKDDVPLACLVRDFLQAELFNPALRLKPGENPLPVARRILHADQPHNPEALEDPSLVVLCTSLVVALGYAQILLRNEADKQADLDKANNLVYDLQGQVDALQTERDNFEEELFIARRVAKNDEREAADIVAGDLRKANERLEQQQARIELLQDELAALRDKTNLQPILDLFPASLFQDTNRRPYTIARRIEPIIQRALAMTTPGESSGQPEETPQAFGFSSRPVSRFSVHLPTGTTWSTIWSSIPESRRQGFNEPTNESDFLAWLNAEIFTETPAPEPALVRCEHPRQLATELGAPAEQGWEVSLEEVRAHVEHICPATAPVPPTPGFAARSEASLFKVSDVPPFEKRDEYWSYRTSLKRFFQGTIEPPTHLFGTALNRILASWTDDAVRRASSTWDISALLTYETDTALGRTTLTRSWTQLKDAFVAACDEKFLSPTIFEDLTVKWYNCRPREGMTPINFFLDFEAATAARDEAAKLLGYPELSEREKVAQAVRVLPAYVRNAMRMHNLHIDNMSSKDFKDLAIQQWTYAPKPAASNTRARLAPRSTNALPAPALQSRRDNNDVRMRRCGLIVSYDTAPAVPAHLRGSIYADDNRDLNLLREIVTRRNACIQANVCEYCRRPRSEHHAVSAQFKEINRSPGQTVQSQRGRPRARIADIPGPRVEEVADDASSASVSLSVD
jgi:hypothetical protein